MAPVRQWIRCLCLTLMSVVSLLITRPTLAESQAEQQWKVTEETLPNGLTDPALGRASRASCHLTGLVQSRGSE